MTRHNEPTESPSLPILMTEKEVIEHLRICKATLWKLVKAGDLDVIRFPPRASRFERSAVERLIEKYRNAPSHTAASNSIRAARKANLKKGTEE